MKNQKIAVIGSGISGLSCAWALANTKKVTLFEKENYFGGHTNTIKLKCDKKGKYFYVDSGFIVFNEINYPNFVNFLKSLKVSSYQSDMSFSVSMKNKSFEYGGKNLRALFIQKKNIFNLDFWRMLTEIVRFFYNADKDFKKFKNKTIGQYLEIKSYSIFFKLNFLYPMAASIWSTSIGEIDKYPFQSFITFFKNHGLLNLFKRPKWRTIRGGGRAYVNQVINHKNIVLESKNKVLTIKKHKNYYEVKTKKKSEFFEHIVIATHSDQAIKLLDEFNVVEKKLLTQIKYQKNKAYVHSDENLMPKRKGIWSSWNYIDSEDSKSLSVTYWMNSLQELETKRNIFVTLNPLIKPNKKKIYKIIEYSHPIFNEEALNAQQKIIKINNEKIWFCGAYLGYGFHEDGLKSGLRIANCILKL